MFKIVADSACNLTEKIAKKYEIEIISYNCTIDNELYRCYEPGRNDEEDGRWFYNKLREGADVRTSLISPAEIEEVFEKHVKEGYDVLFLTISAALSGTYQSGVIACEEINERYPDRRCVVVDSKSASLGEGFLAMHAANMRDKGCSLEETVEWLESNWSRVRHIFTVDDLKYLKKGGRISSAVSLVGGILNIKPLLYASDEAKIELASAIRGRKKSLDAIVKNYIEHATDKNNSILGMAHCDCHEAAEYIINKIKEVANPKEIINVIYDRCTGAHVGPGALCLFYFGDNRDMH